MPAMPAAGVEIGRKPAPALDLRAAGIVSKMPAVCPPCPPETPVGRVSISIETMRTKNRGSLGLGVTRRPLAIRRP